MEWRDEGVLLAARPYGERDAILDVLTARRGRHLGLMRGGASRKKAAELQPGAQLDLHWRARLEDQLGAFRAEAISFRAGRMLERPLALAALAAAIALAGAYLPEREPQPRLYAETVALFDALADPSGPDDAWAGRYAAWEMTLLETLGFGLDLASCAATGATQELIYVSPKSGRAVGRAAGAPYAARLLPLPDVLRLGGPAAPAELSAALRVTGFFLENRVAPALGRAVPAARARLRDALTPPDAAPRAP